MRWGWGFKADLEDAVVTTRENIKAVFDASIAPLSNINTSDMPKVPLRDEFRGLEAAVFPWACVVVGDFEISSLQGLCRD